MPSLASLLSLRVAPFSANFAKRGKRRSGHTSGKGASRGPRKGKELGYPQKRESEGPFPPPFFPFWWRSALFRAPRGVDVDVDVGTTLPPAVETRVGAVFRARTPLPRAIAACHCHNTRNDARRQRTEQRQRGHSWGNWAGSGRLCRAIRIGVGLEPQQGWIFFFSTGSKGHSATVCARRGVCALFFSFLLPRTPHRALRTRTLCMYMFGALCAPQFSTPLRAFNFVLSVTDASVRVQSNATGVGSWAWSGGAGRDGGRSGLAWSLDRGEKAKNETTNEGNEIPLGRSASTLLQGSRRVPFLVLCVRTCVRGLCALLPWESLRGRSSAVRGR